MNERNRLFGYMLLGDVVGFGAGWLITHRLAGALVGLLIVAALVPTAISITNTIRLRRMR